MMLLERKRRGASSSFGTFSKPSGRRMRGKCEKQCCCQLCQHQASAGRTGWAKRGQAVWGLFHPTVPHQQAPSLLGKGSYAGLALVSQSDGLGMKQGMKHVVFFPSASCREEAGLTLGTPPCLVAPHEGISWEGLPGASR